MKIEYIKINKIKSNPNNPRVIKDDKFYRLVESINEFPLMLEARPIVVNDDMMVLGGNMRLKACKESQWKEVPVIKASDFSEEQQREFAIKDNNSFGDWDWDALANSWDADDLKNWGLDVWQPEESIDFNPELNPTTNYDEVTKEEITRQAEEMAQEIAKRMVSADKKQQDAICPKCYHEFKLQM
jgi:ParB-like chromosome segregation protein Spo0J